jgi:hypothetical protein
VKNIGIIQYSKEVEIGKYILGQLGRDGMKKKLYQSTGIG